MFKIKLGTFIESYGDGIHGTPKYDENGDYFFINGNNLINGEIAISKDTLLISEAEYKKIRRPLGKNTLLLSINGTLGRVAEYNGEKIALGKSACYINVKPNVNKKFIKYVMKTQEFQKYILLVAHGSTIKNLAPSQIADYEFTLPDGINIDKVTDLLDSLDKKIKNNNKITTELESLVKTIYDYWFLQFEFPDENGKPYKSSGGKMVRNDNLKKYIPDNWLYTSIVDIEKNIVTGKTPSTSNSKYFEGSIPFITINDLRKGNYISNTERHLSNEGADSQKKKYIPENSICVSCIATVGLVVFTTKSSQTNQQINSIVCKNKYNMYFLFLSIKNYFEFSNSIKTGNIFSNVNKNEFSNIKLLYPSKEILEKYNSLVDPFFKEIKHLTIENEKLKSLRDFLLPMLMNGQINIEDH